MTQAQPISLFYPPGLSCLQDGLRTQARPRRLYLRVLLCDRLVLGRHNTQVSSDQLGNPHQTNEMIAPKANLVYQ